MFKLKTRSNGRKRRRMSLRKRNIKNARFSMSKLTSGLQGGGNEKGYNEQNVFAFEFVNIKAVFPT